MSNFYLDIDGPTSLDRYLQVKHEDNTGDGAVLSVASILDKEDSKVEARKIVRRYNAYEDLVEALKTIARFSDHEAEMDRIMEFRWDAVESARQALEKHGIAPTDETTIGEPTTSA
jgi:hypothetical protein